MKIGIDLDGTVTDPRSCFDYLNTLGYSIDFSQATEYELHTYTSMSQDEFWSFMVREGHEEAIYRHSRLHGDVHPILWDLTHTHDIHYVTARSEASRTVTELWLQEQQLPLSPLIMTGSHDKVNVVKALQLELFLEDRYENALSIHEETDVPVILFDAPYNRRPLPNGVKRVSTWQEAYHQIQQYVRVPV